MTKFDELIAAIQKSENEKRKNAILWALAVIGAVVAIAGIAYAVYRYFSPDYLEDFEDDFDDDFEDFFEDDDFPEMKEDKKVKEEPQEETEEAEETAEEAEVEE